MAVSAASLDLTTDLRAALHPAGFLEELRAVWPGRWARAPAALELERVHFSPRRPPVAQYRDEKGGLLLAEAVGRGAEEHARKERRKLKKTGLDGGPVALPQAGLAVRRTGADSRLPGLALLARPAGTLPAAGLIDKLGAPLTARLRAHRIGRRAVVELSGPSGRVYVRIKRPGDKVAAEAGRHARIAEALRPAGAAVPRILASFPALGAIVLEAVPGAPLGFDTASEADIRTAMTSLAILQKSGPPAARYELEAELASLGRWGVRLAIHAPRIAGAYERALVRVSDRLAALPEAPPTPCHRDFHEKQVLLSPSGPALLDFDTYRLSDPALDAGNLAAHLRLAELRGCPARPAFHALVAAGADPRRLSAWASAAMLRLGALYSFSTRDAAAAARLISEAEEGGPLS